MKFEIKHQYSGNVLFSLECESLKVCLEAAVKEGANLEGANLAGAYLARANLARAYLEGANLEGANLEGAYLEGANLAGANLARAYLEGANLAGANLAGANLAGAYLAGAYLAAQLGTPDGWYAWTYFDTKKNEQRIRVGCRDFSIDEARRYWFGKDSRQETLAAVEYAVSIAKIRKWGREVVKEAA